MFIDSGFECLTLAPAKFSVLRSQLDLLDKKIRFENDLTVSLLSPDPSWLHYFVSNLPFIITIVVVVCAAYVNYKSNKKTIENHDAIANKERQDRHDEKISEFRHEWLQNVRGAAKVLIRSIHECQTLSARWNFLNDNENVAARKQDIDSEFRFKNEKSEVYSVFVEKRAELYQSYANVRLLFKRGDASVSDFFDLLSSAMTDVCALKVRALDNNMIDRLIDELQGTLKSEWEVTKSRDWIETNSPKP